MGSLVSLAFCRMCHNVTCRRNEIEWDWQGVLVARSIGRSVDRSAETTLFISRADRDTSEDAPSPSASPSPRSVVVIASSKQLTVTRESARGMKRAKAGTVSPSLPPRPSVSLCSRRSSAVVVLSSAFTSYYIPNNAILFRVASVASWQERARSRRRLEDEDQLQQYASHAELSTYELARARARAELAQSNGLIVERFISRSMRERKRSRSRILLTMPD